ncbi:DIP1984 family protein [Aureibacillus halotolerans]|nr:DIP1984 family protein [Aureibacillus halotolerans]
MKLAEALILRSDLQKRIDQMKARILRNTLVQEGEKPAEEPDQLFQELKHMLAELKGLIQAIQRTNANIAFDDNRTLADALVERDILASERKILSAVVSEGSVKYDRYSRSEVKFLPVVDTAQLQKQMDDLAKSYRLLDTRIQELNWLTELL